MSTIKKNFNYGELWKGSPKASTGETGSKRVHPSKVTSNVSFIDFFKNNNYDLILDYDSGMYAYTDITNKRVVLNANYSDHMLSVFLKHEMGHLMLFDVNQFVTVGHQTLRSVIARILYTSENLRKYGIEQLLFTENIIQDIIIETVSAGSCVCGSMLSECGENAGVKHLERLESTEHISKEVCKNILVPKEAYKKPSFNQKELDELLDSMMKDLDSDLEEIGKELESVKKDNRAKDEFKSKRNSEERKLRDQRDRLSEKMSKMRKAGLTPSEKMKEMRDKLTRELAKNRSGARTRKDDRLAKEMTERKIDSLEKKRAQREELKEELENAKNGDSNEAGSGETSKSASNEGDGNGATDGTPTDSEVTPDLEKNLTDHLTDSDEGTGGHSCDCGLPIPLLLKREDSYKNEKNLTRVESKKIGKKIDINEDDLDNVLSTRNKIPETELTYFKSNKKEFDATDMMQGKRKLRVSGVNVLIGLDISGSMSAEWGKMFNTLSDVIERLSMSLDIENIVYFTYNTHLKEWSKDIKELSVRAGGGNAFGYVYQEMMQKLPIMQRNEIILVTDLGDNLGFDLNANCQVERAGMPVENHISIIDTEGAGFYSMPDFNAVDWSLHHYSDPKLFKDIESNIERLLDK